MTRHASRPGNDGDSRNELSSRPRSECTGFGLYGSSAASVVEDAVNLIHTQERPEILSMHQFGSPSSDPANYSRSPPLHQSLCFTDQSFMRYTTPQQLDLAETYTTEELMFSGVFEHVPELYRDQSLVEDLKARGQDTALCDSSHEWQLQSDQNENVASLHLPPPQDFAYGIFQYHAMPTAAMFAQAPHSADPSASFASSVQSTQVSIPKVNSAFLRPAPPARRALLPRPRPTFAAPPDATDPGGPSLARGRRNNLSPDALATVNRVRMVGACGRCHKMKHACDDDKRPCTPCVSNGKRNLDLFCMYELPEDRYDHLFTDYMYGHLDLRNRKFFSPQTMPQASAGPENRPFRLRLHQHFNSPELFIPVVRFQHQEPNDLKKSIFPLARDGKRYVMMAEEILSPPLVPYIGKSTFKDYWEQFRKAVRSWLKVAEEDTDLRWEEIFFRPEHGKPWARSALGDVCRFYHEVSRGGCKPLRSALQSTVLIYMLGHSFYVPGDDIETVLARTGLSDKYSGEFMWVSPIYVDRFVKALLFIILKGAFRAALKQLQDLCSPNKHTVLDRDRILAQSIVVLIIAATQQNKSIELTLARKRRGDDFDFDRTYTYIEEVERWVIDLVIELWIYKFADNRKIYINDDAHERWHIKKSERFGLMDRFKKSYDNYRAELDSLCPELPEKKDMDENTFGTTNVDRVLKKFHTCVFYLTEERKEKSMLNRLIQAGYPPDRPLDITDDGGIVSFFKPEPRTRYRA